MRNTKPYLIVLTGAGISAESGLPTFRASDGLWEGHRVEDVATPEAFARNPALVQQFYNERRAALATVQPNAAHHALRRLEREWRGNFMLITQNVDDLHSRADSARRIQMHGELLRARCTLCGKAACWVGDISAASECIRCGQPGGLRPDIVWFHETPYQMDLIHTLLNWCSHFIAIGTSGHVFPAADFVQTAAAAGAHTIEVNLAETAASAAFAERRTGPATQVVPALVEELLAGQPEPKPRVKRTRSRS